MFTGTLMEKLVSKFEVTLELVFPNFYALVVEHVWQMK